MAEPGPESRVGQVEKVANLPVSAELQGLATIVQLVEPLVQRVTAAQVEQTRLMVEGKERTASREAGERTGATWDRRILVGALFLLVAFLYLDHREDSAKGLLTLVLPLIGAYAVGASKLSVTHTPDLSCETRALSSRLTGPVCETTAPSSC